MTDNEIVKALECCKKDDCDNCPNDFGNCYSNLAGYALDIINSQRAEIERLRACVKSEDEVRAIMKSQMMPMVSEIVNEQFDVAVKLAKAEAIKEFAELVKRKTLAMVWSPDVVSTCDYLKVIDDCVKEMVGDL